MAKAKGNEVDMSPTKLIKGINQNSSDSSKRSNNKPLTPNQLQWQDN